MNPFTFRSILLFGVLSVAFEQARAVPLVPTCVNDSIARSYGDLIHQAAVIGRDDRKPITKVAGNLKLSAADVLQIRKTTGFIICPGTKNHNPGSATAFLIGSNQKLMTAGHVFRDKNDRLREPLSDCYFQNQEVPPQKLKLEIEPGGEGVTFGAASNNSQGLDFALVKLKAPVVGAIPLKIDDKERELQVGEKVIMVSAFQDGIKKPDLTQPLAQECMIRDVGYYRSTIINTDCDAKGGGSGSPVITRDKDKNLVVRGMITSIGGYVGDGDEFSMATGNFTSGIGFDGKPFKMIQEFVSN